MCLHRWGHMQKVRCRFLVDRVGRATEALRSQTKRKAVAHKDLQYLSLLASRSAPSLKGARLGFATADATIKRKKLDTAPACHEMLEPCRQLNFFWLLVSLVAHLLPVVRTMHPQRVGSVLPASKRRARVLAARRAFNLATPTATATTHASAAEAPATTAPTTAPTTAAATAMAAPPPAVAATRAEEQAEEPRARAWRPTASPVPKVPAQPTNVQQPSTLVRRILRATHSVCASKHAWTRCVSTIALRPTAKRAPTSSPTKRAASTARPVLQAAANSAARTPQQPIDEPGADAPCSSMQQKRPGRNERLERTRDFVRARSACPMPTESARSCSKRCLPRKAIQDPTGLPQEAARV